MDFESGILGELGALSEDEHPSFQVAAQAYELELQKQKEISFGEWEKGMADYLKCLLGNIVRELQPSEHDNAVRLEVVNRLSMLLNSSDVLRGATIAPFGSFESNFYTEWADLDLSLELPKGSELPETIGKARKVKILKCFMKILIKKAEGHKVQFIPYARVPLLTFEDPHYNISCDISVDSGVAMLKSRLLRWISYIDSRCRDLIFLVKCWAKAHCINDPKTGTLNSYAICLLVIFHLQTRSPPVLPPLNAVLPEDIAKKVSGKSASISREELLNRCLEKIESFIIKKFGSQNRSSLAEVFVSFFGQFSFVSRLWPEGLVACPFTGTWGDLTSTCRQWRSKRYVMAVEDPFDRSENCARSVQGYSLPGITLAFSSTAEAFKRPPMQLDVMSLPEILFCWPEGSQKQAIRMWLSKLYSREGKVAQVRYFKRYLGEGSSSKKIASCQSQRAMHTVDAPPQRDGIMQDKEINIIKQCQVKKDRVTNTVNTHFCILENSLEDQDNERLASIKEKLDQRVWNRTKKENQVSDKGMQTILTETGIFGESEENWKGDLSSGDNVYSAELEGVTSRALRNRISHASTSSFPHSEFSGTSRAGAGAEITSDLLQEQPDEEFQNIESQLSGNHNGRRRRSILREEGSDSHETIASTPPGACMSDHQTAELPFDRNDMPSVEGGNGSRRGNPRRHFRKMSNGLFLESNTKASCSEGQGMKKAGESSVRQATASDNLAKVNAKDGFKGQRRVVVQKEWKKPAEQSSKDENRMQKLAQNEENKILSTNEEHSIHLLKEASGHSTLVQGLQSMQVLDYRGRQKVEGEKNYKNRTSREKIWRPKCQE